MEEGIIHNDNAVIYVRNRCHPCIVLISFETDTDLIRRYKSIPIPGLPFDAEAHVVPNVSGRVSGGNVCCLLVCIKSFIFFVHLVFLVVRS